MLVNKNFGPSAVFKLFYILRLSTGLMEMQLWFDEEKLFYILRSIDTAAGDMLWFDEEKLFYILAKPWPHVAIRLWFDEEKLFYILGPSHLRLLLRCGLMKKSSFTY